MDFIKAFSLIIILFTVFPTCLECAFSAEKSFKEELKESKDPEDTLLRKIIYYGMQLDIVENAPAKKKNEIKKILNDLNALPRVTLALRQPDLYKSVEIGRCYFLLGEYSKSLKTFRQAISISLGIRCDRMYEQIKHKNCAPSSIIYYYVAKIHMIYGDEAQDENKKIEQYTKAYQLLSMLLRDYRGFYKEKEAQKELAESKKKLEQLDVNIQSIQTDDKTVNKIFPIESQKKYTVHNYTPDELKKMYREWKAKQKKGESDPDHPKSPKN